MSNELSSAIPDHGWQPRRLWLPHLGLVVTQHGLVKHLLLPGTHTARWSRSLRRWIYRRPQ